MMPKLPIVIRMVHAFGIRACTYIRTHNHTQTHRHTDTQTHRHTHTDRHTDTQTHRHTDTQTHTHTAFDASQFHWRLPARHAFVRVVFPPQSLGSLARYSLHMLYMSSSCFFFPNSWKLWGLSPDRLRGGSTRVPPGFHEGSTRFCEGCGVVRAQHRMLLGISPALIYLFCVSGTPAVSSSASRMIRTSRCRKVAGNDAPCCVREMQGRKQ